jgi:hypothetical protein
MFQTGTRISEYSQNEVLLHISTGTLLHVAVSHHNFIAAPLASVSAALAMANGPACCGIAAGLPNS